jgi:hypothetical protein
MSVQGSIARGRDDARALRRSNGSDEDSTRENAQLAREVLRLQALCEQHERTLAGLTQALCRARQEALATEFQLAQLGGAAQLHDEGRQSASDISLMARRHRLGFPDLRSGVEPGSSASDGRPPWAPQ